MNMNETPSGSRYVIGLFGRRNAGKSSLINAIAGQNVAVTSEVPGTTTEPVGKAMELLPIGPVLLVDTAELDDEGDLGAKRVEKTYEALRKCNLALVVADSTQGFTAFEEDLLAQLNRRRIPTILVLNKYDAAPPDKAELSELAHCGVPVLAVSARSGQGIGALKEQIISSAAVEEKEPGLVDGLIRPGEVAILVTPIDKAAPKGRLILPQQQAIRDMLEKDALSVVVKENAL